MSFSNTQDTSLAKSGQARVFVQPDGSSPDNPYLFVGCLNLGGLQNDLGTGEPIFCPSSSVPGKFDIVDTTAPPPSLPTTDFTQHMDRFLNDFWWDLRKRRCKFNGKIKLSACARPDDPDDFESLIILKDMELTAFNTGSFNGLAEDAVIDLTGSLQMLDFDSFKPIIMGETADTVVFSEALDGMIADKVQCGGDCGQQSDGCQRMYVLTTTIAASPALASQLVHSKNGGATWATDNITTLGVQAGNKVAQVGNRIVVISSVDLAHHYKLQSAVDAGTSGAWTRVSGGYVASKGPRAIWSKSPSETYVAAAGGYVYFMSNPASSVAVLTDGSVTVQNLNDIRGTGRNIVAVGASNAVIVSYNGGATWSLVTGPAIGVALNTVEVINKNTWFIGAANGKSYFTTDGGASWTDCTPDSAITAVNQIRFVDDIVGYMSVTISGGSRIYRTADNGASWHNESPYISSVPAADGYNFVAPCPGSYNVLLAGGIESGGTDGMLALGVA